MEERIRALRVIDFRQVNILHDNRCMWESTKQAEADFADFELGIELLIDLSEDDGRDLGGGSQLQEQ